MAAKTRPPWWSPRRWRREKQPDPALVQQKLQELREIFQSIHRLREAVGRVVAVGAPEDVAGLVSVAISIIRNHAAMQRERDDHAADLALLEKRLQEAVEERDLARTQLDAAVGGGQSG